MSHPEAKKGARSLALCLSGYQFNLAAPMAASKAGDQPLLSTLLPPWLMVTALADPEK